MFDKLVHLSLLNLQLLWITCKWPLQIVKKSFLRVVLGLWRFKNVRDLTKRLFLTGLCRRTKIRLFRALVLPVLLYGSETWSIGARERGRLNSFSTRALRRIMGYRWDDFVTNERVLREAGMSQVTCMIRQRQLRLFGHVARFPESDPVSRVISQRISPAWRRPRGRPPVTWLQRIDGHCREMGLAGREHAWHSSRRDPQGWRRAVTAATRCLGVCPH